MAKRSRVETERTVNYILDEALNQILTIGFEAMSYTTLSDATGISRTGISHHFPRKTEFLAKLDMRIGQLFVDELNFTSLELLESSWNAAMKQPRHLAVLKLYFSLCGASQKGISFFTAIEHAKEQAGELLGAEGERCIDNLIGRSSVMLLTNNVEELAA
ncbi:TetR family transcriptional regulator [Shewanella sp. WXL01]|uniref:TetR family transcriptional regulator n=1 Tax=Shewanella maritima TaxID=2520507 RepID=A0A411PJG2_9GAMM|nr:MULTISPECIES: TetR family transcriptional regulator [Shewanella]NKF50737.1 TetR family transcriptional regulator [Shewanella sp. WXL01]QBF83727.1 TetR family transcriptional regulator [Shewanella maritima]